MNFSLYQNDICTSGCHFVLIKHVQLKRNNIDAPKVFNKGNISESSFKIADEKKMYLHQLKNIVTDISNEETHC